MAFNEEYLSDLTIKLKASDEKGLNDLLNITVKSSTDEVEFIGSYLVDNLDYFSDIINSIDGKIRQVRYKLKPPFGDIYISVGVSLLAVSSYFNSIGYDSVGLTFFGLAFLGMGAGLKIVDSSDKSNIKKLVSLKERLKKTN